MTTTDTANYNCSYPDCPAFFVPLEALDHDPGDEKGIPTGWQWPEDLKEVDEDFAFSNHVHALSDGSRPGTDFHGTDQFVPVLHTDPGNRFGIGKTVRDDSAGELRFGKVIGWAADRIRYQQWLDTGQSEWLVNGEGPIVQFDDGKQEWFAGESITGLFEVGQ